MLRAPHGEPAIATTASLLAAYVPPIVTRRIVENQAPIRTPRVDVIDGTCLFVDIAGFTPLTEQLSRRGTAGAEEMASLLDHSFGRFIDLAERHGGEIVDFAGDALLAAWWADGRSEREAAIDAVAYASALQNLVEDEPRTSDVHLSVKVTLASGQMQLTFLGGVGGRKHLVLAGEPIARLGHLGDKVAAGEILLDESTAAVLGSTAETTSLGSGAARLESSVSPATRGALDQIVVPERVISAMREFVAAAVPDRLESGLDEWSGGFRRVSSMFINLIGSGLGTSGDVERLNDVTSSVQRIVQRYDGAIHQFIEDDKGTVMLVAFGLPPRAHEDDPARAVLAALEIETAVAERGLRTGIGISTGTAFCGPVGTKTRREFTVLGDAVNLAARLMQAAPDDILVDSATARAFDRIDYDNLEPLSVKGKSGTVPVFRPQGDLPRAVRSRSERFPLVGRHSERQVLLDALDRAGDSARVVVIEGEAGIGKSRLVEFAIEQVEHKETIPTVGTGSAIETSTPYFAWQPILRRALELDEAPSNAGAQRRHVLRLLRGDPELLDDAPLLNDVLGLRLPERPDRDTMTAQRRADRTRRLLFRILQRAADSEPMLIALEDAQWMDRSSWQLAVRVADELPVTFVIATRPMDPTKSVELDYLSTLGTRLHLDKLSDEETAELTAYNLGVDQLPGPVREFILRRAEGHPFFAEELTYALRDSGMLAGDFDSETLEGLHLPDTVQGVVKSRIDQLAEPHRLVLKVASVSGRSFDGGLIAAVHPVAGDVERIPHALEELDRAGLISSDENGYRFRHAITRDVAYESLLHGQRRTLHRSVAVELERRGAPHAVLAHHWLQAAEGATDDQEAVASAVRHLRGAGEAALRVGAFSEAERLLRDALAALARFEEPDPGEELRILRHLGTATFATSGYGAPATREVYERAFRLADGRAPEHELFPILWGLWITTHFAFDTNRAIEYGEELLQIAERADDDELRLQAHHALWTTLVITPDYERARHHLDAGSALYRAEWHDRHSAEFGGHDPGSCARRARALVEWSTGEPDTAVQHGQEAVWLAQDHAFSRLNAMLALAFVYRQRGDLDAAVRQVDELTDLAAEAGLPGMANWAAIIGGWVRGRRGDLPGGIGAIETAAAPLGMKDPGYLAMLVELYLADERIEDGLGLVDELFEVVERKGEHSYEPELHRLRGELLAAHGEREQALRSLWNALEVSHHQGAWSFALRAATSLVKAGADGAVDELAAVYDRFTEGFDTADLVEARDLLNPGLGARSTGVPTQGSGHGR